MNKEFDVNERLNFPEKIISKNIDGLEIILAPDYPTWIVLDSDELKMFLELRKNSTICQTMENFILQKNISEDEVVKIMAGLLGKIENAKFYGDTKTLFEDEIESFPKLIHINLTNNCNLRCRHCYMSAGKFPERVVNFKELKKFFENLYTIQESSEIVLSGGEPLTYKNIFELLNFLNNGKNKITLFTNGTLINTENCKIISKNCDEVQLSFEGVTEECFEKIRGKGTYRKVINSVNLLKSCGTKIILAITLLPMTAEDLRQNLTKFIKYVDYKNLEIRLNNKIEFTGNASYFDRKNFDERYFDKIILRLMKELSDIGINIDFANENNVKFSNCGIGANLVVHYDGNIYPCHKISDCKFKISDDVKEIFRQFNELNKSTSIYHIKNVVYVT